MPPNQQTTSTNQSGGAPELPRNILLVSVLHLMYPVTIDILHQIFSKFGPVLKIALVQKGGRNSWRKKCDSCNVSFFLLLFCISFPSFDTVRICNRSRNRQKFFGWAKHLQWMLHSQNPVLAAVQPPNQTKQRKNARFYKPKSSNHARQHGKCESNRMGNYGAPKYLLGSATSVSETRLLLSIIYNSWILFFFSSYPAAFPAAAYSYADPSRGFAAPNMYANQVAFRNGMAPMPASITPIPGIGLRISWWHFWHWFFNFFSAMPHTVNLGQTVLIVSNLNPEKINPDLLFKLFGVYGDVVRVKILYNKPDTGLVQFTNAQGW